MQTVSAKWIGEQKFVAISLPGHALTFGSDRDLNNEPGPIVRARIAHESR